MENSAASNVNFTKAVEETANELAVIGLQPIDALHVACAILADADYFLTTDKAILREMKADTRMRVIDPIDFVRESD